MDKSHVKNATDKSHCDFQLPGFVAQKHAVASSIAATAFAYSRRTNQRRLEDPFYAFWGHVFFCLIFDLAPEVFLAPQLTLYDGHVAADPDHSSSTIPGNTTGDQRPDFVIMAVSLDHRYLSNRTVGTSEHTRFPTDFMSWDSMKIIAAHPLVVAELKTCVPRSATRDEFMKRLHSLMGDAFDQLEDRADQIFNASNNYQGVDTLVLIAACGEWWRFKIARRDAYSTAGNIFDKSSKDSEMVDYRHELPEPKPKGPRPRQVCRYLGDVVVRKPPFSELFVDNVDQAMPEEDEWSLNINFGSKASNQRMYLIHKLLLELRDELTGGGIPDYSEVRISSVHTATH